jgi:predicted outer membrane repeat protein
MQGGTISGNTAKDNGGGVYNYQGTFTMSGGTISGNTVTSSDSAKGYGGGVCVGEKATFTMSGGTISGNTATTTGGGVYVNGETFTMQGDASVSGNTATTTGGGVYVNGGTFTMQGDASVSGNRASREGGGVYVNERGAFTMQGGAISGNTAAFKGGGVSVTSNGTFAKTGGTIHGDEADQKLKNTVLSRLGHAVYEAKNGGWRNSTAGPTMNTGSYGFWLNDGDVVTFPSGFARGEWEWKRSNFNNTLTITENTMKSSSSNYVWVLQSISGNAYTLKRADAANTMTLTIRLEGGNLVISGDSGSGENNWNGTWQ